MQITVSLAQMHIQVGQVEENMTRASDFISQASSLSSTLVLLPELWSSGYDLANAAYYAQAAPEIVNELQRLAKQIASVWAVPSSCRQKEGSLTPSPGSILTSKILSTTAKSTCFA